MNYKPHRSMLFLPVTRSRAVAKARELSVDAVILDLEDAVHPDKKQAARESMLLALNEGGFGASEILVRINALDTEHWQSDLESLAKVVTQQNLGALQGLVIPKVESLAALQDLANAMEGLALSLPIWIMLETPRAVLDANQLCRGVSGLSVVGVLIGTADLSAALLIDPNDVRSKSEAESVDSRIGLTTSLGLVVLAARAAGIAVVDGVYMNIRDDVGFSAECEAGRRLGFDGKSLIHPSQVELANTVFSPSTQALDRAKSMIEAWETAAVSGEGVCVFDNQLVEKLHVDQAKSLLARFSAILG